MAPKIGMSLMRVKNRSVGLDHLSAAPPFIPNLSMSLGDKSDEVFSGGISLGYDFAPRLNIPVRLELDYTARSEASVSGSGSVLHEPTIPVNFEGKQKNKISLQTLMLNAWFDIPTGTAFSPYVGGGIGWAFIRHKARHTGEYVFPPGFLAGVDLTHSLSGSSKETNFAWSLGGGLTYDFTPNWTVDFGYRYINAGDISTNMVGDNALLGRRTFKSKVDVESHDIMLALRFTF